jgi:DNA-binding transcriptional LysR family regulator
MNLIDHLEKLKYFSRLYGFKSLKEASKSIGISQVGLSKNIAILESILDTKLIIRNHSGIRFTPEGERLYQFSSKLIESTLSFQSTLALNQTPGVETILNLETYDSIAVYFIPELFEYIQTVYPSVTLNVKIDHSRNIIEKLHKNKIDLAIGVNLGTSNSNYKIHKLFNDTYACYINPRAKGEIEKMRIILHPKAADLNGKTCLEYLAKPLKTRECVMSENFETIKSLTLRSIGIGVLPRNVAAQDVRSDRLVKISLNRLPETFGTHEINFAHTQHLMETHNDLIQEMIRIGNSWSSKVKTYQG